MATGQKTRQQLPREATMKYKFLIVSLMSTLSVPYGGAMDQLFELPFTNSRSIATANEMQNQAAIAFSRIDHQVGGKGSVEATQRLHILTTALDSQAASLNDAVNNLTVTLAEIPGIDLRAKIANLTQAAEKEKMTKQDLMQALSRLQNEQAETNVHLKILEQHFIHIPQPSAVHGAQPYYPTLSSSSIPSSISPSHSTSNSARFSSYQQGLLTRKDQIGSEAWKLLGGENANLADALFNSIQQNSGTVEILSLENDSFYLSVDGKRQGKLYKF